MEMRTYEFQTTMNGKSKSKTVNEEKKQER